MYFQENAVQILPRGRFSHAAQFENFSHKFSISAYKFA